MESAVQNYDPIIARASRLLAAVAALLASTWAAGAPVLPPAVGPGTAAVARAAAPDVPPNIILITTDDQNLDELRWMPKSRRLLGGHGVTFTRALSPAPVCCPARAEIVTGQLGQNNGVRENTGPHGGYHALRGKQNTLALWLRRAGYRTAMIGKYLNGYTRADGRPKGWTIWNASVQGLYSYTATTFLGNGHRRTFHRNVTPVISDFTARTIRRFAARGGPFFIWASHVAPHDRYTGTDTEGDARWRRPLPTARHRHVLTHVRAPVLDKPSFNTAGGPDEPYAGLRRTLRPDGVQGLFTTRLQSLQDVDDAVARVIDVLRDTGELDHTYVVLASDNGVLLGEHRLLGKNKLYDEDLAVPLLVRVPAPAGAIRSDLPVTMTDLAPTFVELAGARAGRVMDGRSFAGVLAGRRVPWRDTQLIQTGSTRRTSPDGWEFRGVWTPRYTLMRRVHGAGAYLYDRRANPYETRSVAGVPRYHAVLVALLRRLRALEDCAGASCNRRFGALPRAGAGR